LSQVSKRRIGQEARSREKTVVDDTTSVEKPGQKEPITAASTLPFDRLRLQVERQAATMRLLARLKTIDSTQEARSARACASVYVRKQAPPILRLLEAGVGIEEILANLAVSFPSISRAALRHAIGQLRDRRQIRT
jgi:hypothetical protein